jgi:hypothetical protein
MPEWAFTSMPFGIRINLDDYDLRAPSYTFRHPTTWELMPNHLLPQALLPVEGRHMLVMLGNPITKVAFFCMRGVREYHEHPEHTGNEWLLYRGSVNVYSTLTTIVRSCCEHVSPIVVFAGNQLLVRWVPR